MARMGLWLIGWMGIVVVWYWMIISPRVRRDGENLLLFVVDGVWGGSRALCG